jgi:hypothetical protein
MKKFNAHYQLSKYANIKIGYDYSHFFRDYFPVNGVPYIAVYSKEKKLNRVFEGKTLSKQIKKALQ